ncbi:UTRA domain-containing protein [Amycolatopsis sp. NPDC051061]|uniref:UTRA domain-containing protein n=1 Tax=Amycolatopsis sp. NPDC051061 TaxID=3155042 RepID=UPI003419BAC7
MAVDRISARPPTVAEVETLELPEGTPVIRQLRTIYSDDQRPVEASVLIIGCAPVRVAVPAGDRVARIRACSVEVVLGRWGDVGGVLARRSSALKSPWSADGSAPDANADMFLGLRGRQAAMERSAPKVLRLGDPDRGLVLHRHLRSPPRPLLSSVPDIREPEPETGVK